MAQKQIIDGRFEISYIEQTGSTNADLVELAKSGTDSELIKVLVADYQTQGRGRLDRRWEAKSGEALLASFLIWDDPKFFHHINICLALAALDAVTELADSEIKSGTKAQSDIKIKWPNDLVVSQGGEGKKDMRNKKDTGNKDMVSKDTEYKKLGGILAETVKLSRTAKFKTAKFKTAKQDALIIGIGINLKTPKLKTSKISNADISNTDKSNTENEQYFLNPIGLEELCPPEHLNDILSIRNDLLELIAHNFKPRYDSLTKNKQEAENISKEVKKHLAYIGSEIEVQLVAQGKTHGSKKKIGSDQKTSQEKIIGKILGMNSEGHLMLETETGIRTITTGDISRLRA